MFGDRSPDSREPFLRQVSAADMSGNTRSRAIKLSRAIASSHPLINQGTSTFSLSTNAIAPSKSTTVQPDRLVKLNSYNPYLEKIIVDRRPLTEGKRSQAIAQLLKLLFKKLPTAFPSPMLTEAL